MTFSYPTIPFREERVNIADYVKEEDIAKGELTYKSPLYRYHEVIRKLMRCSRDSHQFYYPDTSRAYRSKWEIKNGMLYSNLPSFVPKPETWPWWLDNWSQTRHGYERATERFVQLANSADTLSSIKVLHVELSTPTMVDCVIPTIRRNMSTLTQLILPRCGVGEQEIKQISRVLANNSTPSLESLDLSASAITNNNAIELFNSIYQLNSLQCLAISDCNLGTELRPSTLRRSLGKCMNLKCLLL